jgi:Cu+-exporting ATPase
LGSQGEGLVREGRTVVFVAEEDRLLGMLGLADTPKASAREAVTALRHMGMKVVMMTGDSAGAASAVASAVGIETVLAEVLPARKAEEIARLRERNEVVAMVGDGINDAPALAAADIGVALGAGTDVAMEASDITLMTDDLRAVPEAIHLSRATMRVIRQNLFWAFLYNVIGIPVAAGVLYPFGGILLTPEFAAAAMALSSVSVVANALRLRRRFRPSPNVLRPAP